MLLFIAIILKVIRLKDKIHVTSKTIGYMEKQPVNNSPETEIKDYKKLSEQELACMVYKFDSRALEELYNRYSPLLYSLICQITLNDEAAEDILAGVFAIVWKRIDRFDLSTGNFYTWITTIARNKAADYLRRNRDDELSKKANDEVYENFYIIPFLSSELEPLDLSTALRLKNNIDNAIVELSDVQKYIIHLVYYEGYTISGISKKLNITRDTVFEKVRSAFDSFLKYLFPAPGLIFQRLQSGTTDFHHFISDNLDDNLYAYSIGCQDIEKYAESLDAINNLPADSKVLFGILQTVESLLPVIIDLKTPGQSVKNKAAKELYNLSKNAKLKRNKDLADFPPLETVLAGKSFYEKYFSNQMGDAQNSPHPEIDEEFIHTEKVHPQEIPFDNKPVVVERPVEDYESIQKEKLALIKNAVKKDFRKILIIDLILVILISVLIGGGVYYFLNQRIKSDQTHISRLNGKIDNLNSEISRLHVDQQIFALQNSKGTKSYPLDGTGANTLGFGKLIVSSTGREGLLQLFNMPELPEDKVYQLWLLSKGQSFSLGTFRVTRNSENFLINELPEVEEKNMDSFLLTAEDENGASTPSNEVYLERKLNKK